MPQGKNRYPGIRSFEADDQILFNGRSKEIDELFNFIKIKPLIVLFGKSGLGKTSLLKAGVGPLLLKQHYFPIIIRLQDTSVSPSASVLNALEKYVDPNLLEKYGNKTKNKIWEYLNAAFFKEADGSTATPVLVFDQFEELFNHPKDVQEEFTSHIGDLTEHRMPSDIEGTLNQVPRSERTKELMSWFHPPNVKIVFAIRSDRMSELHKMRYEIPAILQNRYELKPLHTQQAKDAITKPASLTGKEFSTAPFTFAPETIEKIQSELSNEFGEIESFQLQIICQYIERNVGKQQSQQKENIIVTKDYLGGEEGIRGILKNYYNTQISLLGNNEEQQAARSLIEEGLIVSERRIGVAEAVVKETYNINDDLLAKLLASRLIRPEDTRLGRTYEISHDTLVKPILDAYRKRKNREARMKEIEQREIIIKKRKRARIAAVVNFLIAVGSVIGLVFVYNWYTDAENAKSGLEDAVRVAVLAQSEAVAAKVEAKEAKKALEEYLATTASETLEQIDSISSSITKLETSGKSSKEMQSLNDQREKLAKTKSELEKVLRDTGTVRSEKIEKINSNRREEVINNLVLATGSEKEAARKSAVNTILRSYKNDPTIITDILNVAKDNVDKKYLDNIYQIIYVLENASPDALNGNNNTQKVQDYINAIRNANLVGNKTLKRIDNIENKLRKTNNEIKPEDKKTLEDKKKPEETKKPEDGKESGDAKKSKDEKESGDGKKSNDENQGQF